MSHHQARQRRKADLSQRLASGRSEASYCRVVGCTRATPAAIGKGLARRACRPHEDHHGRHGSYVQGTYPATTLAPHRSAALAWLQAHQSDPAVTRGAQAVQAVYAAAGQAVGATNLAGLPPAERSRAAWARLRVAKVSPVAVLAVWLAIEATIAADPSADTRAEFKRVQAAKVLHRMASGTHRKWERQRADGSIQVTELHKYPASRGRVLRHIGEQLERVAELVAVAFLQDLTRAASKPQSTQGSITHEPSSHTTPRR